MTLHLTIIGLGQIGASIGLALAQHADKIKITGSDIDSQIMNQAKKLGAVERTTPNLGMAIRNADIIILALPSDQVQGIMEAISPELKEGVVLMDTSPVKVKIAGFAQEILPENCTYVGFTPALNPRYLHNECYGIAAAKADLFQGGIFCIATPPKTNPRALKFATDLSQLMGADPLFVDLYEIDGLMASTHVLPQLMSIAMLNATQDQPGWGEARKVAGRAFAEVSGPAAHLDDSKALATAARLNQENVMRTLDDAIAALMQIRDDIAQESPESLEAYINHARDGANQWRQERGRGNWLVEELPRTDLIPRSSDIMGSLLGLGFGRKKKKE